VLDPLEPLLAGPQPAAAPMGACWPSSGGRAHPHGDGDHLESHVIRAAHDSFVRGLLTGAATGVNDHNASKEPARTIWGDLSQGRAKGETKSGISIMIPACFCCPQLAFLATGTDRWVVWGVAVCASLSETGKQGQSGG